MSEHDIFAALRLGVKFDTKRFEKDIKQFEPKSVAAPAPKTEGTLAVFQNLTDAILCLYTNSCFLPHVLSKLASISPLYSKQSTDNACR
jgi:hypothetical protein